MFKNKSKIQMNDINELYYIIPIENLDSVLKNNILSNKRAQKLPHKDISDSEVQELREIKIIRAKEGRKQLTIHQHVNFYLQPHNAMMHTKMEKGEILCVLRVRKEIFQRGDAILSDRNAATNQAKFFKANDWQLTGIHAETVSALDKSGKDYPGRMSAEDFKERK